MFSGCGWVSLERYLAKYMRSDMQEHEKTQYLRCFWSPSEILMISRRSQRLSAVSYARQSKAHSYSELLNFKEGLITRECALSKRTHLSVNDLRLNGCT